jgi:thymidylate synthase (FAD)
MGHIVNPKVYKIAETKIDNDQVFAWLKDLGGEECLAHVVGDDKEKLIELCGRRCYKSYVENLNKNVTRIRKDSAIYHDNVLKSEHGSILEHATITFAIENISRVATHELIRHRAGAAISQESLRFVRLTDINMYFPKIFGEFGTEKEKKALELATKAREYAENIQVEFMELYAEEMESDFDTKKKLTSAFRRYAPDGLATGIIETFNYRAIRHIVAMRTSRHAEEEIRDVAGQIAEIAIQTSPMIFGDFEKIDTNDGLFEYVPKYKKV